jgi:hypothetical protein
MAGFFLLRQPLPPQPPFLAHIINLIPLVFRLFRGGRGKWGNVVLNPFEEKQLKEEEKSFIYIVLFEEEKSLHSKEEEQVI